MADFITDGINTVMNGKTAGIPNILIIAIIFVFVFFIYIYATKKPKVKEFKPKDVKKETRKSLMREYKFFGMPLGKNIYVINDEIPCAFAIGYMKIVENKPMKRLEPIWIKASKEQLVSKHEQLSAQIYNKSYSQLTEIEKKNVDEASKEELRYEAIEELPAEETNKTIRGKREIKYSIPVPMICIKFCQPAFLSKLLARYLGIGLNLALFNNDQIDFQSFSDRILITANFQRRSPFDIFVFSKEGKNLVQDISYGIERENIWQETANQIPRAVHFDTEASKMLLYRREDAKIEKDKRQSQSETHGF